MGLKHSVWAIGLLHRCTYMVLQSISLLSSSIDFSNCSPSVSQEMKILRLLFMLTAKITQHFPSWRCSCQTSVVFILFNPSRDVAIILGPWPQGQSLIVENGASWMLLPLSHWAHMAQEQHISSTVWRPQPNFKWFSFNGWNVGCVSSMQTWMDPIDYSTQQPLAQFSQ